MKKIIIRLMNVFDKIHHESYLGYDTISFLMTLFGAIFGSALIAFVVFGFTSLICLLISLLFLWMGFGTIADKICLIPYIMAVLTLLVCCVLLGASTGVKEYKKYLEYDKDYAKGNEEKV